MTSAVKKGRRFKDPIIRLRTLFWYWAVRNKSGLNDGTLDELFSDAEIDGSKRKYEDRNRMFEDIRKTGRKISTGDHYKRPFYLVDRVNGHPDFAGSKKIYENPLWEILTDPAPSLEKTRVQLLEMRALGTLNQATFTLFRDPNPEELEVLSESIWLDKVRITKLLENEIDSDLRDLYDSVFDTFNPHTYINHLGEKVDFKLFSGYLEQLAFSIVLYRYAMFTSNFHALIASADFVNANLSYIKFAEIQWIDPKLCKDFFKLIYKRVFMSSVRSNEDQPLLGDTINHLYKINSDSALEKLIALLDFKFTHV